MQGPDAGDDHHPPRLRLALAAAAAGLVLVAPAAAGHVVSLPSPLTPLSPSPPLGGGATSAAEGVRHRIRSAIRVHVSVSPGGAPFAVSADQTLVVTVTGDYFFTIGAPLLGVQALPGSDATPGLRSTSIIWQGFNPHRRTLKARATLDPAQAAAGLPLRIEVHGGATTFINTTGTTAASYTADADPAPLDGYLRQLRRAVALGRPLPEGTVTLTSTARLRRVHVAVPLRLSGTVGGRPVDATVTGRLTVPARGRIDLSVEPQVPAVGSLAGLSGRAALARATTFVLTVARLRQFETFLGNPDPAGSSASVYRYQSAVPPRISVALQPAAPGRNWTITIAVIAGALLATGAGLAVWARG